MAAAAAWRARFVQRVESAHEHLRDLNEHLVTLEAFFLFPLSEVGTEPDPEAEMAALRVKLDLLMGSLRSAAQILNSAIVHMQAATILAVHGGNTASPWVPVTSIQSFGPHDAAVKAAMGILETSHDLMTLSACKLVEWSRGHLSMAIALVGSPGIPPDGMAFAKLEYDTAHTVLRDAMQRTQAALAHAAIALQVLTP
ncbi:hypothetical protein ACQ4PT_046380 [Festuca glaucescens]